MPWLARHGAGGAGHQGYLSIIHGEWISCPELSPRPPAAKHGANPSPRPRACRDAHTWSTGWGRGGKLPPASPEAGPDPPLSRNVACPWWQTAGDGWENSPRWALPGASHQYPTSVPLAPQPMGHCPIRGDHDGCPALGAPDVTHGASQEAGDSRAGQSRCGGSCATGLCHPHPCQLRGAAARSRSDATAPGLANASRRLHKRGEAGRQAGRQRPWV